MPGAAGIALCENPNKTLEGIKTSKEYRINFPGGTGENPNKTLEGIKTEEGMSFLSFFVLCENPNKTLEGIKTKVLIIRSMASAL
ncbi:hypothetical protein U27_01414 [Candidatus Vecturithrix granuli]|uniref:Uncharacterized protein n=1 Tax=Vecturithrix granuli TaxID=1499967 RepID=A0A081CAA8_VECG1|nr:hypothetical protein U27_01414 [Candidatus Vecturithrix granuli]